MNKEEVSCERNKAANKLLYGIGEYEDGTVGLTIFEEVNSATLYLSNDMLKGLIAELTRYSQKESQL